MRFYALLLLLLSTSAFSKDFLLSTIYRDTDAAKTEIVLSTKEDGSYKKARFLIYEADGRTLKKTVDVSLSQLKQGKTVLSKSGVSIIKVRGNNFDALNGGVVKLRYLKKFRLLGSNSMGTLTTTISPNDAGDWTLKVRNKVVKVFTAIVGKKGISGFEY
jgi:hypothetical protein